MTADGPHSRIDNNQEKSVESRTGKSAILLLTHLDNRWVFRQFSKLIKECSDRFDVFFLCDNSTGRFDRFNKDKRFFLFSIEDLAGLDYPGKVSSGRLRGPHQNDRHHQRFNFDPGNVDLPVLLFFRDHPQYARYWVVEYDVRFSGGWDMFFSAFEASPADLLGTTLTRYDETPDWHHWPTLDLAGKPGRKEQFLRGFFPIYRLSRRALERLDSDYRNGVQGHFECLVPTLLALAGMTIEDIGGDGAYVRPGNRNRFYRNSPHRASLAPGTFVFRPVMDRPGAEPGKLWHPVRPSPVWTTVLHRSKRALLGTARRIARPAPVPVEPRIGDPDPPFA